MTKTIGSAGLWVLVTLHALAQQTPIAQIPLRRLSAPVIATDTIGTLSGLKQFADGTVIINDITNKRLVVYDSGLTSSRVVADQTGKASLYPASPLLTRIFDYLGDSALFTDHVSQVFLLIEPSGRIGRALAHPKASDLRLFSQSYPGEPAFDRQGRLIYRAASTAPVVLGAGATPPPPGTRDTSVIVRADFTSRLIDTIARITYPTLLQPATVWSDKGIPSLHRIIDPMPLPPDEWAVTSSGALAILKASDYHIDWVLPDGNTRSTPKMPFDWRRLTDADKQARIDSAKQVIDSLAKTSRPYGWSLVRRGIEQRTWDTVVATIEFVPISSMPDYVPPFRAFSLKPDRDNRLWIPPTTTTISTGSDVMYDVINTNGEIVERVLVPADRLIVGFGPRGVVYLVKGDRKKGYVLERRQIVRNGN
jgi:hypothetical protein